MTFEHLTDADGEELLTLWLADFPAKTSVPLEQVTDSMESEADFGQKWRGSFAKFDHSELKWKTAQCSLLGDSEEFSETWPRWGSMRNGECLERTTPELRTSEKESGFWPTVRASDGERGGRGDLIQAVRGNSNKHFKARAGQAKDGERGPLNPMWTEWLMGWPLGWTELEPLAMDKFREWQQQHSICSHEVKNAA
jgi:hypothetical protein